MQVSLQRYGRSAAGTGRICMRPPPTLAEMAPWEASRVASAATRSTGSRATDSIAFH